jgi:hypothetical protein
VWGELGWFWWTKVDNGVEISALGIHGRWMRTHLGPALEVEVRALEAIDVLPPGAMEFLSEVVEQAHGSPNAVVTF